MQQTLPNSGDLIVMFKLMIYDWNLKDAIKYHESDNFCHDDCIGKKHDKKCPLAHSGNTLNSLIVESQSLQDLQKGKLYCLYLIHQKLMDKNRNHNEFALLFAYYGDLLHKTGKTKKEYLKSKQYFEKSLSIKNKSARAHHWYAILLAHKLKKYQRAEAHYQESLKINPRKVMTNVNLADLLFFKLKKYSDCLIYCTKACEYESSYSRAHCIKGFALFQLNRFDEAIDELLIALTLNDIDHHLSDKKISNARRYMQQSIDKYMEQQLKCKNYFTKNEGLELMKWLYNCQLLSIKRKILMNNISLSMLKQCTKNDIENLIKEMGLTTASSVKFRVAVDKLQTDVIMTDEAKIDSNKSYDDLMKEVELLKEENGQLKQVMFTGKT